MNNNIVLLNQRSLTRFTLLVNITASFLGMAVPALSQTLELSQNAVNLEELVQQWGYTTVNCSPDAVFISQGSSAVCVSPTSELQSGYYIYNPDENELVPVNNQTNPQPNPSNPQVNTQPNVQRHSTPREAQAPLPELPPAKYEFTSSQDYGLCLEDILQLYIDKELFKLRGRKSNCLAEIFDLATDRGLSQEQAVNLIKEADIYATTILTRKLFPLRGQRRRIAQLFGFIYEIDNNDPEIQRLAAQSTP